MLTNTHKNRMGTVSFDGKFDGMRKAQDFIVYPMKEATESALVQSDTRIGRINLQTGDVIMSPARSGGAYFVHLMLAKPAGTLTSEELLMLKAQIFATAHGMAGSNGIVYTDNSAALEVFNQA